MLKIARRFRAPLILVAALSGAMPALADDQASPRVDKSLPTPVIYPSDAQKAGEQGDVVINIRISQLGKPIQVAIARSSGFNDLDNAALETVLAWHYLPAVRDGDTVSAWTQLNVVYKLAN